ncbi:pyridoxamine 5'-phosphate oxidase family protein [Cryobacterium melibiosiphilum]|uniref:Pyridoxamine 5'-phosphate oxidase family protein n=1 Tax=Cryobacterium melibiosiphilum TaxID=995039 RepID=A0A3A5MPC5_9MICO|nr:pyridoxamine 5'-phosphate oxidase family protein [Cryobacterium melibiosiphilum]RJT87364.1 pyridoxamine 5'-phosphate oxidase family protein [Cryobacterium melibiosiphilum]
MNIDGTGHENDAQIHILTEDECWEALLSSSLGRLAVSVGGNPEIFPVNFIAVDRRLLFRTSPGTKLVELTVNNRVAFETDGVGRDEAWSVVIKGVASILERQLDIDTADMLPLRPLIPTVKHIYVEIKPTELTGRRFHLGPEPLHS